MNPFSEMRVLTVCGQRDLGAKIRMGFVSLGITNIIATTHSEGLRIAQENRFSHIVFEVCKTDITALEFLKSLKGSGNKSILVAIYREPVLEDVIKLAQAGAQGVLASPFTPETIEETLEFAEDYPGINEQLIASAGSDPNSMFSESVLDNLYRVSILMRETREFPELIPDLLKARLALRDSARMARTLYQGGEDNFQGDMVSNLIRRVGKRPSRLGSVRRKLRQRRGSAQNQEAVAA